MPLSRTIHVLCLQNTIQTTIQADEIVQKKKRFFIVWLSSFERYGTVAEKPLNQTTQTKALAITYASKLD